MPSRTQRASTLRVRFTRLDSRVTFGSSQVSCGPRDTAARVAILTRPPLGVGRNPRSVGPAQGICAPLRNVERRSRLAVRRPLLVLLSGRRIPKTRFPQAVKPALLSRHA